MNTTTKIRFRVADQGTFNQLAVFAREQGLIMTLSVEVKTGWFTETRKNWVTLIASTNAQREALALVAEKVLA